ncbi:MAG TPA: hypothetical protein VIX86_13285, partial [Streptosporangiaceae bacterium]
MMARPVPAEKLGTTNKRLRGPHRIGDMRSQQLKRPEEFIQANIERLAIHLGRPSARTAGVRPESANPAPLPGVVVAS